ncbi:MAG: short-chain dehydrogenase, partial [Acidobacteria bacterium]
MPRLRDKAALLTGAASGIGRATAFAFADEGAMLALADLNGEALRELEEELRARGANVLSLAGDVSLASYNRKLVEDTVAQFGR